MTLPLFDPPPAPRIVTPRIAVGGPEYQAYYAAFHLGAADRDMPDVDGDDALARYAKDGFRIGRLFRPLPCMRDRR